MWYYGNSETKRKSNVYPDGGFMEKGDVILICECKTTKDGAVKAKILHEKNNIVYIVFTEGDENYFFNI